MAKTAQRTATRPEGADGTAALPGTMTDLNHSLMNAALRYQTQAMERMMGMARGGLAFGARRLERETDFWTELVRTRNPRDFTALYIEFLRTAQHDYLDEVSRQMELLASATTDAVADLESQLDESEDVIQHAIAKAEAVAV
ncbi:MAG: phasin family protein [Pseudooceanicola sp.]